MKYSNLKSVITLLVVTLMLGCSYGQRVKGNGNTVNTTRNVGNFDEVAVSGSFDVFLVSGDEGRLELRVEENLEPYLITEVQNGTLKIKWKRGTNIRTTGKTTVTVHFENIKAMAMAGSGDIESKDVIRAKSLKIAVAGSGDIKLDVEAEELEAAISGSGDIKLAGKATELEAAVSGSGDMDAYDLMTEKSELQVSGSGFIGANVEKEIIARISGSGNIKYKGKPRIEDTKVSGSGKISMY